MIPFFTTSTTYNTTPAQIFETIKNGRLFELTGADEIKFNFVLDGGFKLLFKDRGAISGTFQSIEEFKTIKLTWLVSGFGRAEETTEVDLVISPLEDKSKLDVIHSGLVSESSMQAKARAWGEILNTLLPISK